MGQDIPYRQFTRQDIAAFKQRLESETAQLEQLFRENSFIRQHPVGGLELEAWLVDSQSKPAPLNVAFLEKLSHPEVVPELSLFNVELNVAPQRLQGMGIRKMYDNLRDNWLQCTKVASQVGVRIATIGTLPSLLDSQLTLENMSQSQRYKVLNEQIFRIRKATPITLDISGREHLCSVHDDVMLEAATTSFQIHMQVTTETAVADYNASQVISAPLIAIAANSPYVFGVDLLDESRVPIFEQSIDLGAGRPKRVCFGERYLKHSLFEIFADNHQKYAPLIPLLSDDEQAFLPHLRLQNGTIWRWNRPIVALSENGQPHLRIENRVVPSGPTLIDMLANAAFYWGSVAYLREEMLDIEKRLPFNLMKQNFYRATRNSLDSELIWMDGRSYPCSELLAEYLIPRAKDGLRSLGVDDKDASDWMGVLQERVRSKQNGASWQRAWIARHGRNMQALTEAYLLNQESGRPVHEWAT